MKGFKSFLQKSPMIKGTLTGSFKPGQMLLLTSETDNFTLRLLEILNLPDGWYFGKGRAPSLTCVAMAALSGHLMRQAGADKQEIFPSEDGGILVCGYHNNDTMEVFCGPSNLFRFSFDINDQEKEYSEGLTLPLLKEKIRRYSWKKENLFDYCIPNTIVQRRSDTSASPFRIPVIRESRWSAPIALRG